MEGPPHPKPAQDKTVAHLIILALFIIPSCGSESPHQIKQLTWQVISQTGDVVWNISQQHALNTWWPQLTPDFCSLAAGLDTWDIPDQSSGTLQNGFDNPHDDGAGCRTPFKRCRLGQNDFYVCPRDGLPPAKKYQCGGLDYLYCAAWGCETTGDAYWNPSSSWDLIQVKKNYEKVGYQGASKCLWAIHLNQFNDAKSLKLKISFTDAGKKIIDWTVGREWGLRWYMSGKDRGLTFKIKLRVQDVVQTAIGPNLVLPEQKVPEAQPADPAAATVISATAGINQTRPQQFPGTGDRLLNLLRGAYQALNSTSPERAKNCWLCLNPAPPYYEGIAYVGNFSNLTTPSEGCKDQGHRLTLSQVTGSGLCIGNPPSEIKSRICNQTRPVGTSGHYLAALNGTFWACSTGLTPCISLAVMNQTKDYCVLVQLWPRITYHTDDVMLDHYDWEVLKARQKREPVTLMTLAMLLGIGGIATGAGLGSTALLKTRQLDSLQQAMTDDLRAAEQAIRDLKDSVASLSEVVLQNRRGLDLVFLKEGGLCAALKEECCFYVDKTGLVTETLDRLKERLDNRKREYESRQSWYENLWNQSPWFTTLISSLMGPLVILLLILTFGPCIINRLTQFVKDRLSVVQTLVLAQRYQALKQSEAGL